MSYLCKVKTVREPRHYAADVGLTTMHEIAKQFHDHKEAIMRAAELTKESGDEFEVFFIVDSNEKTVAKTRRESEGTVIIHWLSPS